MKLNVIDMLMELFPSICNSRSQCRRFIKQNAVRVGNISVVNEDAFIGFLPFNDGSKVITVFEPWETDEDWNVNCSPIKNNNGEIDFNGMQCIVRCGKKNRGILKVSW